MRQSRHTGTIIRAALLLASCGAAGRALAQAAAASPQPAPQASPDATKAVLTDADHLLRLARELKASVDKTRRFEMSMQVIREADEIEKLAREAKTRIH